MKASTCWCSHDHKPRAVSPMCCRASPCGARCFATAHAGHAGAPRGRACTARRRLTLPRRSSSPFAVTPCRSYHAGRRVRQQPGRNDWALVVAVQQRPTPSSARRRRGRRSPVAAASWPSWSCPSRSGRLDAALLARPRWCGSHQVGPNRYGHPAGDARAASAAGVPCLRGSGRRCVLQPARRATISSCSAR